MLDHLKNIKISINENNTIEKGPIPYYRIILFKKKPNQIKLNSKILPVIPPSLICLNETDILSIHEKNNDITEFCFTPKAINENLNFYNIQSKKDLNIMTDILDSDSFRPFYTRNNNYLGIIKLPLDISERVFNLIKKIQFEFYSQSHSYWPCKTRSLLIELLFLIIDLFNNSIDNLKFISSKENEKIKDIINYIILNYTNKITITELTKKFYTNRNSLNIKFKQYTGYSVMEYISRLRINISQSLLKNTLLQVAEIAYNLGYKDPSHFEKVFKKYTGLSPKKFRNS